MLAQARCYGAREILEVGDGQALCEESAEAFFVSNGEMNLAEALSIEAGELSCPVRSSIHTQIADEIISADGGRGGVMRHDF
jgi:hypothetical protein